ncbi:MAG: hypothetical protein EOO74_00695 [Myxococcales bacterium]|nr:MAG: hypothetical protein EOO74_00695 [Myxococcales bacterium]
MRLLARAAVAPLLILALAACGSEDSKDSSADSSSKTSETAETTDGYPTDASVSDYCAAYKGEEPQLDRATATVGDMIEFLETGSERIEDTGIPANFTDAERKAFDEQLVSFKGALKALQDLDQDDTLVTDLRQDEAAMNKLKAGMDVKTPQALKDYSSKNC